MATRTAMRYVSRRLSSSGKILNEEEKAAENVYIKKIEQEKLEKLARKGPKPEEKLETSSGSSTPDVKQSSPTSTSGVSTDKYRNYAVVAGAVTILGGLGWYLKATAKKPEEVQD
ncbi:uncharacterized protein At2g27730, mitochondrial [Malania oleifera]|uniref:uncharacterized protein At2g27730, mitochondrial n=1 Tax=Malania oleifera TaxID=397392 RepID=UPI0025AE73AE|nr:uncharacterized protein At2g27730, mitochondrial [Malania oleifera]XP_057948574.1 uncharacterized protein At2g27730, mitochondrial [Malania oleifera]XP_057948575.1 uncharacterized protein At2g27730, mitochondrial [Malania oleifera]